MILTAVVSKRDGFCTGEILEIPSVFSQGRTMEEAKANLLKALDHWLKETKWDVKDEDMTIVQIESLEIKSGNHPK